MFPVAARGQTSGNQPVVSASAYIDDDSLNEADLSTYTFAARAIGVSASPRAVLVCIYGSAVASRTISSVTIGGVAAAAVVSASAGTFVLCAMYIATIAGDVATADVVVAWSGVMQRCHIHPFNLTNLNSNTPTDTATDNIQSSGLMSTNTLDISAGGCAVGFVGSGGVVSWSWVGLTEAHDASSRSSANDNFASAQTNRTISAQSSDTAQTGAVLIAAAFR